VAAAGAGAAAASAAAGAAASTPAARGMVVVGRAVRVVWPAKGRAWGVCVWV
jgi:hypothetical protein